MDIRNRRALKEAASAKLAGAQYDPRKLVLLHAAISLGAALLIALAEYYLNHQIESTGGLSGMGMRTVLETVQTTLQYVLNLALPFWEIGFLYAALQMARGERADLSSLPEGFRRFGPVFRLHLLEGIMYLGIAIACMYVSSLIFMLTPFSANMMEMFMPLMEQFSSIEQIELAVAELPLGELVQVMIPYFVIFGVLSLVVAAMLFYRFRVADFIVMDQPKTGALQALVGSSRMTRRKRMALLKLDLSFWWFYLLLAVALLISNGDLLLTWAGITLPFSANAAWFVFYLLGVLAQLAVYWYGRSYVQTTYAVAYEVLLQEQPEEPEQPVLNKALPWDDYNAE